MPLQHSLQLLINIHIVGSQSLPELIQTALSRDENLAALANQMLQTGLLTKNYCNDFNALQRQSFYEITGVTTAQSGTTSSCNEQRQFVVTPVPGTAVFLLVVEELAAQEPCCQAACSASLDAKRCEAPCFVPLALRDACASFEVTTEDANLPSCPGRAAPIPPNTGTVRTTLNYSFPLLSSHLEMM